MGELKGTVISLTFSSIVIVTVADEFDPLLERYGVMLRLKD